MHLVFATSLVPDGTLTTGYEIANAAIIEGLERAGVQVSVIGFTRPGSQPSYPNKTAVIGSVDPQTQSASWAQRLRWLSRALVERRTFSSVKLRQPGEAKLRKALQQLEPFDAYVLNGVTLAGAYQSVFAQKPSIFIAHNVEHRSASENAAASRSLVERMLYLREARLLRGLEKGLCERARFVFTLADEDREPLGIMSDDRSASLPLVVATSRDITAVEASPSCDCALIGTWTWQPNRIGLDWFLNEVVPHLPADIRIKIAGRMPDDLDYQDPRVEFVGRVADAQQFASSAKVIPLISRAGTGIQLKTLEAFTLGMPAVATASSLRGIKAVPSNCIARDDAKEFADALASMVENPPPRADGKTFARLQRAAMDHSLRHGLAVLSKQSGQAAA